VFIVTFKGYKMKFLDFLVLSNYCATHAAKCILYKPNSRPAKLAKNVGYTPTEDERKKMRYLIAGKSTIEELFPESNLSIAS